MSKTLEQRFEEWTRWRDRFNGQEMYQFTIPASETTLVNQLKATGYPNISFVAVEGGVLPAVEPGDVFGLFSKQDFETISVAREKAKRGELNSDDFVRLLDLVIQGAA